MKRLWIWILVMTMLSGCSGENKEIEQAMALREKLLNAKGFSFSADITADYGDKLHLFSMDCQADEEGDLTFTVTKPETIAGITGRIQDEGGELTFDETVLFFELLTDEQLSPVSAPWILVKTLRSGYLTSACEEGEGLHLTIDDSYEDDALMLDIWLDGKNLPKRAEILYDGRRILTLDVKNAVLS